MRSGSSILKGYCGGAEGKSASWGGEVWVKRPLKICYWGHHVTHGHPNFLVGAIFNVKLTSNMFTVVQSLLVCLFFKG